MHVVVCLECYHESGLNSIMKWSFHHWHNLMVCSVWSNRVESLLQRLVIGYAVT